MYIGKDIPSYKLSDKAHSQKLIAQKQNAEIAKEVAIDQTLEENHYLITALAESILLLNGFHKHKGSWRKING